MIQENKKLSGITLLAIDHFYKIQKMEAKIDKICQELNTLVKAIPESEIDAYVSKTTEKKAVCGVCEKANCVC